LTKFEIVILLIKKSSYLLFVGSIAVCTVRCTRLSKLQGDLR